MAETTSTPLNMSSISTPDDARKLALQRIKIKLEIERAKVEQTKMNDISDTMTKKQMSEEKAKQLQIKTAERIARKLKEDAIKQELLQQQILQQEEERKHKYEIYTHEIKQQSLQQLHKDTLKRLKKREKELQNMEQQQAIERLHILDEIHTYKNKYRPVPFNTIINNTNDLTMISDHDIMSTISTTAPTSTNKSNPTNNNSMSPSSNVTKKASKSSMKRNVTPLKILQSKELSEYNRFMSSDATPTTTTTTAHTMRNTSHNENRNVINQSNDPYIQIYSKAKCPERIIFDGNTISQHDLTMITNTHMNTSVSDSDPSAYSSNIPLLSHSNITNIPSITQSLSDDVIADTNNNRQNANDTVINTTSPIESYDLTTIKSRINTESDKVKPPTIDDTTTPPIINQNITPITATTNSNTICDTDTQLTNDVQSTMSMSTLIPHPPNTPAPSMTTHLHVSSTIPTTTYERDMTNNVSTQYSFQQRRLLALKIAQDSMNSSSQSSVLYLPTQQPSHHIMIQSISPPTSSSSEYKHMNNVKMNPQNMPHANNTYMKPSYKEHNVTDTNISSDLCDPYVMNRNKMNILSPSPSTDSLSSTTTCSSIDSLNQCSTTHPSSCTTYPSSSTYTTTTTTYLPSLIKDSINSIHNTYHTENDIDDFYIHGFNNKRNRYPNKRKKSPIFHRLDPIPLKPYKPVPKSEPFFPPSNK